MNITILWKWLFIFPLVELGQSLWLIKKGDWWNEGCLDSFDWEGTMNRKDNGEKEEHCKNKKGKGVRCCFRKINLKRR